MKHIADKHQTSVLLHAHNSLLTAAVADSLSSFQSLRVDAHLSLENAAVFSLESMLKANKCNSNCTENYKIGIVLFSYQLPC